MCPCGSCAALTVIVFLSAPAWIRSIRYSSQSTDCCCASGRGATVDEDGVADVISAPVLLGVGSLLTTAQVGQMLSGGQGESDRHAMAPPGPRTRDSARSRPREQETARARRADAQRSRLAFGGALHVDLHAGVADPRIAVDRLER